MRARHVVAVAAVAAWSLARTTAAFALDPGRRITEYTIRTWGEAAGLPQATVRAFAQTPDGYLWIATESELSRFDGVSFTTYDARNTPALDEQVRALLVDRGGDLWVGLLGGAQLLRFRDRHFERAGDGPGFPPTHAIISSLEDSAGRVWFGSWFGVAVREGRGYRRLGPEDGMPRGDVWAMAQTTDGALWFGTSAALGCLRSDGRGVETVALPASSGPIVRALSADPDGGLWVGTDADLFFRSAGGAWRRFGTRDGLPHDGVTALLRDSDGSLWIGTTAGLARRRPSREGFEVLASPALADDWIRSLFEDREGNLWLGTRSAGAIQVTNGKLGRLTRADGLPSERASAVLAGRDGALWIGTSGDGLIRYRDGRARHYTAADGLCAQRVYGLAEARGHLWVAGGGGPGSNVCALDLETETWRSYSRDDGTPVELAYVVRPDPGGGVWVGADRLLRVDGNRLVPEPAVPGATGNQYIFSLLVDRTGALWQGALSFVARRDPGGPWSRVGTRGDGLVPPIRALHEDARGSVWLGTNRGLARWRDGRVRRIGRDEGLADEPVFSIAEQTGDAGPAMWLGTAHGLLRVDKDELDAVADGKRHTVTVSRHGVLDGMPTGRCENGEGGSTVATDGEGRLWFPTARGLVSVDSRKMRRQPVPATADIERVSADGHPVGAGLDALVPAGTRELGISYTAPALTAPGSVEFRYRLDPFDVDWVPAGRRREAFYTSVPPGRYRFRVLAGTDDHTWSAKEASLALVIAPRMHQTWWFRSSAAAAVLGLLLGAHRLRTARLRARHALLMTERTRIARDIHDTLAQGFTGISLELEAVAKGIGPAPDRVRTSLDKARVLVRMSLADARRAVWDLRDRPADGDLEAALARLARDVGGGAQVRVSVSGTVRRLPPAHESALLRIAQEALTNASRHSGASAIDVTLTFGPATVELRVRDDGRGFAPEEGRAAASGHFGLLGMKERAENLDGTVQVQSRIGDGTDVIARLPIT